MSSSVGFAPHAGPPRGGGKGDNDPGAHGLQGGPLWGRWLQGAHRNDPEKSVGEA